MKKILTWEERCEKHPDHNGVVTTRMIQDRMQEEIDELRSRLEQGEKAIALRFESGKMVAEAIKESENLKCCGNCKLHLETCPKEWNPFDENTELIPSWGYCEQWTSDNMTRKEREG